MGKIFLPLNQFGDRNGSIYNFPTAKDTNVVQKPKKGNNASRMYTVSTDSGQHHRLPNIQESGQ